MVQSGNWCSWNKMFSLIEWGCGSWLYHHLLRQNVIWCVLPWSRRCRGWLHHCHPSLCASASVEKWTGRMLAGLFNMHPWHGGVSWKSPVSQNVSFPFVHGHLHKYYGCGIDPQTGCLPTLTWLYNSNRDCWSLSQNVTSVRLGSSGHSLFTMQSLILFFGEPWLKKDSKAPAYGNN